MDSLPTMTDSQCKDVNFLVESLDIRSDFWMVFNAGRLKKAAESLEQIHPLRFLEHVGTQEETRDHFVNISESRWTAVLSGGHGIKGFCQHCEDAAEEGTMTIGLVGELLKTLDVAVASFESMVNDRSWGPLASDIRTSLDVRYPQAQVKPMRLTSLFDQLLELWMRLLERLDQADPSPEPQS